MKGDVLPLAIVFGFTFLLLYLRTAIVDWGKRRDNDRLFRTVREPLPGPEARVPRPRVGSGPVPGLSEARRPLAKTGMTQQGTTPKKPERVVTEFKLEK
ncbi:MAG TPA: hypothetical protein VJX67_15095 [Blastocatellia bacterium]|nr:hypothetical protein [Blastocatellia bacterium]